MESSPSMRRTGLRALLLLPVMAVLSLGAAAVAPAGATAGGPVMEPGHAHPPQRRGDDTCHRVDHEA